MAGYDPDGQRNLYAALIGVAVLAVVVAVGIVMLVPKGGARGAAGAPPGLFLVNAGGGGWGGAAVTGSPAVDSTQIGQRLLAASATTGGDVEVSLAWNSLSDLDLEVRDPFGELVWADDRQSRSGGVQDVDANPTLLTPEGHRRAEAGQVPGAETVRPIPEFLVQMDEQLRGLGGLDAALGGRRPGNEAPSRFTKTPVEHIYFARAPKGTYTVLARCYSSREPAGVATPCTVEVRWRGKVFHQVTGTLGPHSYAANGVQPLQVCQFTVK
jgi:hypothetical protein